MPSLPTPELNVIRKNIVEKRVLNLSAYVKNMKKVVMIGSVVLVCLYLPVFLYLSNIGEVYFHECIKPIVSLILIGLILIMFFLILTRSLEKSCICSLIFCITLFNYALIEKVFQIFNSNIKYWHFFPSLIFGISFILYIFLKKCSTQLLEIILIVVSLVIASLLLMNIVIALPKIISTSKQSVENNNLKVASNDKGTISQENIPNIYYFIFDEYSSFDVLETYFDYDNYAFADYLEAQGFSVSYDSQNDSQQTHTIIANYINLDYVATDDLDTNERAELIKSKLLFSLFENEGYYINPIVGADFLGLENQVNGSSITIEGIDFESIIYKNTAYYPFIKDNSYEKAVVYNKAFDTFQDAQLYKNYPEATFHMLYFILPHQPFIFDQGGGEVPLANLNNWLNKEYYLGQLIYTTKRIENTIDNIISNDPNSIIILQSDHSARSLRDESGNYLIDKYDRRHILNAVYYCGEDVSEIKSKSGVNTLRLVINRLFDKNLPQLEVPISEYEF